jgi:hypothetical protein
MVDWKQNAIAPKPLRPVAPVVQLLKDDTGVIVQGDVEFCPTAVDIKPVIMDNIKQATVLRMPVNL